ncbi:MAG TPA: HPF/RaiA family ribosome-associated protein [Acetobacteraceae bacterium]|nr:HPF/RaiA family ribosome-associated protein [Acetobacteraceae bacterium]
MASDVRISFRGMDASPSVESQVRRKAAELQLLSDRVTTCRVTMEAAHRRHHQGKIYHVHIDLALPGGNIVVSREPGQDHAHEDLHVAVRDAFEAARRQLQEHIHRNTGQTKRHEAGPP